MVLPVVTGEAMLDSVYILETLDPEDFFERRLDGHAANEILKIFGRRDGIPDRLHQTARRAGHRRGSKKQGAGPTFFVARQLHRRLSHQRNEAQLGGVRRSH